MKRHRIEKLPVFSNAFDYTVTSLVLSPSGIIYALSPLENLESCSSTTGNWSVEKSSARSTTTRRSTTMLRKLVGTFNSP